MSHVTVVHAGLRCIKGKSLPIQAGGMWFMPSCKGVTSILTPLRHRAVRGGSHSLPSLSFSFTSWLCLDYATPSPILTLFQPSASCPVAPPRPSPLRLRACDDRIARLFSFDSPKTPITLLMSHRRHPSSEPQAPKHVAHPSRGAQHLPAVPRGQIRSHAQAEAQAPPNGVNAGIHPSVDPAEREAALGSQQEAVPESQESAHIGDKCCSFSACGRFFATAGFDAVVCVSAAVLKAPKKCVCSGSE